MGPGRVAPTAIVAGLSEVGRAEVGCGDQDGRLPGSAPPRVVAALDLKASAAAQPIVEQSSAERSSVDSVALAVEISIPTSSTYRKFHTHIN